MDFFGRMAFQNGDGWSNGHHASMGCPECEELKRKAQAIGSNIPEAELACSKCKKKKRKPQASFLIPAQAPSGMEGRLGQAATATTSIPMPAPAPAPTPAAAAPVSTGCPWVTVLGIMGLLGIGYYAIKS